MTNIITPNTIIVISLSICITNSVSKAGKLLLSLICITIQEINTPINKVFTVAELPLQVKRKMRIEPITRILNNFKMDSIYFFFNYAYSLAFRLPHIYLILNNMTNRS